MLIGVDGNEANLENRVGIGQYVYQILKGFHGKNSEDLLFQVYLKEKPINSLPVANSRFSYKIFGPKPFWTQFALPLRLCFTTERPNIFFTPTHYLPRFSPIPSVMSIMDLSYIFFPHLFQKKDLWQLKFWTSYSVKKAKKILTISQFSKSAIVDYYKVEKSKVVVIYPDIEHKYFNIDKISNQKINKMLESYKITNNFILFVGTLQPRKNIIRLIEAFSKLLNSSADKSFQLVIVGKKGWLFNHIFQKVRELKLENKIIFTGYVHDEELAMFYRRALCFVLPSLYEGFGLPVVEAMACGCPVVTSNVSSLPEIALDCAILVDPYKTDDIAEGIYKASYDNKTRDRLIARGLNRAKIFNWDKCCKETLEVLKKCAI
ncbi:hypothetical protein A2960_01005 [Candidatus Gottesmanbacteria bacterium RIFCSPLOWO2_01_FULL_39_12b]|uniref:Glycosyl transferase family 1 domain-containing protein n=1 Tax=Candidatus Gottesmanbacteria bacterium RIFCSPLOWO2_01_FULL_39_12b TaxID=1798388 RepID=A0A1F6APW8_9BACT|nr:MAG: hypothetical protein A2960_01005 [Candidatus Gottesmanbacteria bacterium RIFCSPLOWO2_01_FULL_39_12b]